MTKQEKLNLVTNYFAEDWAIEKAMQLLDDYEKRLEALSAAPAGWKLVPAEITREMSDAWQSAFHKQLHKRINSRGRLKSAAGFKKSCEEVAYVAMLAASPTPPAEQQAATKAAPVLDGTPPPCEQELFDQGVSVGLFDLPKWTAEEICRGIAAATGARVDWHYIGGRVHIKALPAARAPADSVTAPAGFVGPDGMMRDELRSMIEGMSVSVDVSTGDHDAGHRYFGTVTEVMDCRDDKHNVMLLVQDAEPNFATTPPAQAADSVLEDAARLWDAFTEAWRHEVGVDKIVNIMGGADKLKAVFLDAARKQGGTT